MILTPPLFIHKWKTEEDKANDCAQTCSLFLSDTCVGLIEVSALFVLQAFLIYKSHQKNAL